MDADEHRWEDAERRLAVGLMLRPKFVVRRLSRLEIGAPILALMARLNHKTLTRKNLR